MIKIKKITLITIIAALFAVIGIAATVNAAEIDPQDPMFKEQITQEKTTESSSGKIGVSARNYYFGVDVSEHDGGSIDWAKAKKAGVKFAIVRVACAGWSTGNVFADKYYEKNIKNAKKQGIKVGAYIYSQATTKAEARTEANYIVKKLKPLKSYINMPVVWDMESPKTYSYGSSTYKTYWGKKAPSKATNAANWKEFAKIIKNAGYTPMFYSYTYWVDSHMTMSVLNSDGYPFWLAEYTSGSKPSKYHNLFGSKYPYDMWQYSSTKSVSGIGSNVDVNRWYTDDIDKYTDFTGKASISADSITDTSATVSWKKVSKATKYKVVLADASGKTIKSNTTTNLSYQFVGLKEKTVYKAYVTAYKDSDAGKKSNVVSFTTKESEKTIPAEPYAGMVKISSSNASNYSTIKWNAESQATKYVVQISTNKTSWSNKAIVTTTSYKLSGLSNGNAKYARVIPYKGNEKGKVSNVVIAHGKFKYTVKDSKGDKMSYKLGSVYYTNKHVKAIGNIKITAKTKAKNGLVLRKKASASSKKIITIPYNKTVTIISQGKSWNKVSYKKGSKTYKGYVANAYLH